jgi:hypothetical protein
MHEPAVGNSLWGALAALFLLIVGICARIGTRRIARGQYPSADSARGPPDFGNDLVSPIIDER